MRGGFRNIVFLYWMVFIHVHVMMLIHFRMLGARVTQGDKGTFLYSFGTIFRQPQARVHPGYSFNQGGLES